MSKRTVEAWFQTAILEAIHPKDSPTSDFEGRLSAAVEKIRHRLKEPPATYDVMLPVQGMSTVGLPLLFGSISFFIFTDETCQELSEILEAGTASEDAKARRATIIDEMRADVESRVFARVSVKAVDESSARLIATRDVRLVLDAINFIGFFVPYNNGQVSLPGDSATAQVVLPVIRRGEKPAVRITYSTVKPYSELKLEKFVQLEDIPLLQAVESLLNRPKGRLQAALLSAVQWAGRSATEKRNEEAFLLLVVALEALLLCDGNPSELNYRLRIRLAHLLGGTFQQRASIAKAMSALYTTRSQIVHAGKTEVTDSELSLIRAFTTSAIYRVLVEPPFTNMVTPDHFREWFDSRILGQETGASPP